ncbi:MAG: hypothetical protein HQK67_03035 [Desulfamplus sp.]|nr:hypothetical protein [Desulfamplus sp.]
MKKSTILFLFLNLYQLVWRLALPILRRNLRLRQGIKERTSADHLKKADIWIHGASAGECYLAVELVKNLYNKPDGSQSIANSPRSNSPAQPTKILLTATTIQGMELLYQSLSPLTLQNISCGSIPVDITWFPFDIPDLMEKAICKVKPDLIVLLETELWPSLMVAAKKHKIKIAIINGRLSRKSHRNYMKTRWLWQQIQPDAILAISHTDAERFKDIFPCAKIDVMPNMKFDTLLTKSKINKIKNIKLLPANIPVSILASIRMEEEDDTMIILDEIIKQFPEQLVCLFPRHMHRIEFWKEALSAANHKWILRSNIDSSFSTIDSSCSAIDSSCIDSSFSAIDSSFSAIDSSSSAIDSSSSAINSSFPARIKSVLHGTVILWDIFGELQNAYSNATVAFVGGSLKALGGHNFMEPLASGAVTVTGPFIDDFAWVGEDIFDSKMIRKAANRDEVIEFIVSTLKDPPDRKYIIEKGLGYLRTKQGGTAMACKMIKNYI